MMYFCPDSCDREVLLFSSLPLLLFKLILKDLENVSAAVCTQAMIWSKEEKSCIILVQPDHRRRLINFPWIYACYNIYSLL